MQCSFRTFFITSQICFDSICGQAPLPQPHSQPHATTVRAFFTSIHLPFLAFQCKWKHIICSLIHLASFTQQRLANYNLQAKSSLPPVFVNKIYWNIITSIPYCLCLLSHYNSRAEQLQQREYGPQSLKYFPSGLSQKKFADL